MSGYRIVHMSKIPYQMQENRPEHEKEPVLLHFFFSFP